MTDVFKLLGHEEGYSAKPYYCSEGYPTVGVGIRIGPKGAPLAQYQFTVPRTVADVWVRCHLDEMLEEIRKFVEVDKALRALNVADGGAIYSGVRSAVLLSMCYQMGVDGVDQFRNTLRFMQQGDYVKAAVNMLASKWAKQTPNRAARHAKQMQTGLWAPEYK